MEKLNVGKFYKWKIKVYNDKNIQWLNVWFNVFFVFLFFSQNTGTWKLLSTLTGKSFLFYFPNARSFRSKHVTSYKTMAIPGSTKRVLFCYNFSWILEHNFIFFNILKNERLLLFFKKVNPKLLLKSKEQSTLNAFISPFFPT